MKLFKAARCLGAVLIFSLMVCMLLLYFPEKQYNPGVPFIHGVTVKLSSSHCYNLAIFDDNKSSINKILAGEDLNVFNDERILAESASHFKIAVSAVRPSSAVTDVVCCLFVTIFTVSTCDV
jgi:hypothetical protein